MSCKEICAFLCDYVDGTLAAQSRDAFDAHMAACVHCKEYLDTYAETIRLSKRCCCPKLQPPPPLPEDMIAAIVQAAAMAPRRGCGGGDGTRDGTRDETGDRSGAGRA
jgi:anti-sigma factor RsiW